MSGPEEKCRALRCDAPVVKWSVEGCSCELMEEADAGEDCALDRGRCPGKLTDASDSSTDAW